MGNLVEAAVQKIVAARKQAQESAITALEEECRTNHLFELFRIGSAGGKNSRGVFTLDGLRQQFREEHRYHDEVECRIIEENSAMIQEALSKNPEQEIQFSCSRARGVGFLVRRIDQISLRTLIEERLQEVDRIHHPCTCHCHDVD